MSDIEKKPAYTKVGVDTPLHIDFAYWKSKEENWRTLLLSYLCDEHKQNEAIAHADNQENMDFVDPETGEVTQRDLLLDTLFTHCAKRPDFVAQNGPLTDTIFRVFLANGNQALSAAELGDLINKPAGTILKTLTARVYRGIKAC